MSSRCLPASITWLSPRSARQAETARPTVPQVWAGGGGGGGSSDLSKEPLAGSGAATVTGNAQDPRLIVAGGGGGGGGQSALNGGNGGNAGGSNTGPGAGACGGGVNQNGGTGGTGGVSGSQGGAGAAVNNTSGGGGGGAGSSYLGVEVPGASAPSTITTATSQSPSVTISWSLVSLVFSGKYSADINGPAVSGSLRIISSRGVVRSATGELVIQVANGGKFRVSVDIGEFFGARSGQIVVSGPGLHATVAVNIRSLHTASGLLTGEGKGYGLSHYSLSFTL
jgi:hypothetical protein